LVGLGAFPRVLKKREFSYLESYNPAIGKWTSTTPKSCKGASVSGTKAGIPAP